MVKILRNINKRLESLIIKIEKKDLGDKDKLRYHANSILEIIKRDCDEIRVVHIWDYDSFYGLEWSVGNCFTQIDLNTYGRGSDNG